MDNPSAGEANDKYFIKNKGKWFCLQHSGIFMPLIVMYASRLLITLIVICLLSSTAESQTCTVRGQTPATAFPVCGKKIFEQTSVPLCSSHALKVPGCNSAQSDYKDTNPYWYKFTCYQAGTLGFVITPNDLGDDYDWQLYDITGHNPEDVFTNSSLVVTGNWAGTFGLTGAKAGGLSSIQCGSLPEDNKITFSAMPNLIEGHNYLLLISHFTQSQSGYGLSFSGGTASITDPILPALKDVRSNCEDNQIILRINKKVQCSSLATDGSDFTINAPGISIIAAEAPACESGFDVDSIVLTLSDALAPGNYLLTAKIGTDDNTLLDNCDNELPEGDSLPIVITPKQPTPFDSITPPSCAPQVIELVFSKPIRCSTIAADGSDFSIAGNNPVSIDAAYGSCTDDVSSSIFIHLSHPLVQQDIYTVTTQIGLDGNVIVDECGQETTASQSVSFTVKDTVSAAFATGLGYGCQNDTITALHDGSHDVNTWQWNFSTGIARSGETAQVIYDSYGEKTITLIASNGFCSDTTTSVVNLDNELKAAFILPDIACPKEAVIIKDTSIGNIISYQWSFGNGSRQFTKEPLPQTYPQATSDKHYEVQLVVENNLHCTDTVSQQLFVAYSCHLAVPSAFTPNGDGLNDFLYPVNAYKADNLMFTVYNRLGQVVFQTQNRFTKWDGTMKGQEQPAGTYVWTLQFKQHDTQQPMSLRGTAVLIR